MNRSSFWLTAVLAFGPMVGVAHGGGWMQFVDVGDAGNAPDPFTGLGAVDYEYQIGKYEVTNSQWTDFLNAAATDSDPRGLYNVNMATRGIIREANNGGYRYVADPGLANRPVRYVSWRDAARFTNWLHNGMESDPATTEFGAYDATTFGGTFPNFTDQDAHNPGALYWLPTEDEWYKAAFFDPTRAGVGGYWFYPTQSNLAPVAELPPGGANSANYDGVVHSLTDVGAYVNSSSFYGTFDQAGNVDEWIEDWVNPGSTRLIRGGNAGTVGHFLLSALGGGIVGPQFDTATIGVRIAHVPEPGTLACLGGGVLLVLAPTVRCRRFQRCSR